VCYELQGDLYFATAEKAHRTIVDTLEDAEFVVLDFRHVGHVDSTARAVINRLAEALGRTGRTVVGVQVESDPTLALVPTIATFVDADAALEWCEDALLGARERPHQLSVARLDDFDVLDGLDAAALAAIELTVEVRSFRSGQLIFRQGDDADRMFFLLRGQVSVQLALDTTGRRRRLATFGPGVAFGEMALLDESERSADVVCDTESVVASLTMQSLRDLDVERPEIGRTINANVARLLARRLRAANAQIRALAG
jgi:glutaminase